MRENIKLKISKDEFYQQWDLKLLQQIKTGDTIIAEIEFALPNFAKDKVWEIMNNGQADFNKIIKVAEEFDLDIDGSGLIFKLTLK